MVFSPSILFNDFRSPNKSSVKKCTACKGSGMETIVRQMGPMMTQQQITCRYTFIFLIIIFSPQLPIQVISTFYLNYFHYSFFCLLINERSCKGQGETIPKDDLCKTCNGKKIVRAPKKLEVNIKPVCPFIFTTPYIFSIFDLFRELAIMSQLYLEGKLIKNQA